MKSESELKFLELLRKPVKSKEEVAEKERWRNIFAGELKQEIMHLSKELIEAGCKYTDPWDLVNTKESYPEAIDILVKHASMPYHDRNKEGIIRALSVKEAKGKANTVLISEYNKIPKEKHNLRWVIGNAICVIITTEDTDSVLSIVEDKENGMSRDRFVLALGRIRSDKVEDCLIKLLDDSEMVPYALQALRKIKSKGEIISLTNSSNDLIKKEAQKTLAKIE